MKVKNLFYRNSKKNEANRNVISPIVVKLFSDLQFTIDYLWVTLYMYFEYKSQNRVVMGLEQATTRFEKLQF